MNVNINLLKNNKKHLTINKTNGNMWETGGKIYGKNNNAKIGGISKDFGSHYVYMQSYNLAFRAGDRRDGK